MAELIPFPARTSDVRPTFVEGEARCVACKHEWLAHQEKTEAWTGTDALECPACGCMRGQFKWPFSGPKAEEVWTCPCGGHLFMITRPGTRCVGCGLHQKFPG